jgi:hypothetical protein
MVIGLLLAILIPMVSMLIVIWMTTTTAIWFWFRLGASFYSKLKYLDLKGI